MYRHVSQDVCPWNVEFSRDATERAFTTREFIDGKDAETLATEMRAMSQEEFSTAFRTSPIKRAKRGGLTRTAAMVLANLRQESSERTGLRYSTTVDMGQRSSLTLTPRCAFHLL